MSEPLFEVRGLRLSLPDFNAKKPFRPTPRIEILHGLDFDIPEGACLGIVGESGSGKSTLGRTLVRLFEPTAGSIGFAGREIAHLDEDGLRPMRREMQVI
ncbi:MAG: ATP-binding cassette domain-containing protein, partial [Pseudomonadota bacterium]